MTDSNHGAPEGNKNAQTHGLFAIHDGYFNGLNDDEKYWVVDMHQTLLNRCRRLNDTELDQFDTESLKTRRYRLSYRVAQANAYFAEHGVSGVRPLSRSGFSDFPRDTHARSFHRRYVRSCRFGR